MGAQCEWSLLLCFYFGNYGNPKAIMLKISLLIKKKKVLLKKRKKEKSFPVFVDSFWEQIDF